MYVQSGVFGVKLQGIGCYTFHPTPKAFSLIRTTMLIILCELASSKHPSNLGHSCL